jgi:hypothetical protein
MLKGWNMGISATPLTHYIDKDIHMGLPGGFEHVWRHQFASAPAEASGWRITHDADLAGQRG